MERKITAGIITRIGVLGAIAAVLFVLEFPVIGFYKMDFSTLPALLGGFALGPIAGLAIVLIKDVTGLLHSSSFAVGELADFVMSGAFVLIAAACYKRNRTRKGALIGMAWGVLAMTVLGALMNYYVLIPFYVNVMNLPADKVIGMISAVIPAVDSFEKVIVMATVPFNILKGVVLSLITLLLYKRLSPLLHGKKE